MSAVTVLIIGCGVAGPVLANLLKRKGYNPIVFEKVARLGDPGASLMLMPNGLKVLGLAGTTAEIEKESRPLEMCIDATSDGEWIGSSDVPLSFKPKYGQHAMGVKRTDLNLKLKNMRISMDVDLREGWRLEDIEEADDSVTAHFKGGRTVRGSFLIGCDGIKAASRKSLLKNQEVIEGLPSFTGLTQTAGLSKTPQALTKRSALRNWYGEGIHMIAYPVSPEITSWALTVPDSSGSEAAWGLFTGEEMEERKQKLLSQMNFWGDKSPAEIIVSASRIIKFGIYDREEMRPEQWHSRRCVLVGDAAHPTSPHFGQGANQALEDCFHLSHSLPYLVPENAEYQQNLAKLGAPLTEIFTKFAEKRQPRTSALVKGARAQGQMRVVTTGPEDCKKRNEQVAAIWKNHEAIAGKYDALCREPFQGTLS